MSQDLQKYVRTPMTNSDLKTYMNNELAKIQQATDTFFAMLGVLNMLAGFSEGDFIVTVIGGTTAGAATYTQQRCRFTKIGRLVIFTGAVAWSGHTGTGAMTIGPLPFAPDVFSNPPPGLGLFVSGPTGSVFDIVAGGLRVQDAVTFANKNITAAGDIRFAGAYYTAS
jgi:hypothetical protein